MTESADVALQHIIFFAEGKSWQPPSL